MCSDPGVVEGLSGALQACEEREGQQAEEEEEEDMTAMTPDHLIVFILWIFECLSNTMKAIQ